MAAKSYSLTFDGYWREPAISGLSAKPGIYGVYACVHDAINKTVDLKRLLYIGEAADVQARVAGHEKWSDWKRQLKPGEVVCFSAALIGPEADRQRAEAAMIFKHKPPCNAEYMDAFPFDTTTLATGGKSALMVASFMVVRTERATTPATRAVGSNLKPVGRQPQRPFRAQARAALGPSRIRADGRTAIVQHKGRWTKPLPE